MAALRKKQMIRDDQRLADDGLDRFALSSSGRVQWRNQQSVHYAAGWGRTPDNRERVRPQRLNPEIEGLLQIRVEAGAWVHILRMIRKLSHGESLQPVHLSWRMELGLSCVPLASGFLPHLAYFPRSCVPRFGAHTGIVCHVCGDEL